MVQYAPQPLQLLGAPPDAAAWEQREILFAKGRKGPCLPCSARLCRCGAAVAAAPQRCVRCEGAAGASGGACGRRTHHVLPQTSFGSQQPAEADAKQHLLVAALQVVPIGQGVVAQLAPGRSCVI